MSATEILEKMNQLSTTERLFVIEKALKSLIDSNLSEQMTLAAESMENEYKTNAELTSFSNLDFEDFYEAK
jgi:hypothetical protein